MYGFWDSVDIRGKIDFPPEMFAALIIKRFLNTSSEWQEGVPKRWASLAALKRLPPPHLPVFIGIESSLVGGVHVSLERVIKGELHP